MRSFWLTGPDEGKVLELRQVDVPEPSEYQILVEVRAAGLNRGEFLARRDLHGNVAAPKPAGNEAAGVVVKTGTSVTNFKRGDRVMGVGAGAFSEYVAFDSRTSMAIPERLSWEEAACVPLVFLVVHDMLVSHAHVRAGEWVLVLGASSGVGVGTIQLAKAIGAKTIGTSRSKAKLDRLLALGLNHAVELRDGAFATTVSKFTSGRGADVIVNNVGASLFAEAIRALAFEGRFATVGYMDGETQSTIDVTTLHANRLNLFGVSALLRPMNDRIASVQAFKNDVIPYLADGKIQPVIDRVYSFADLPAAKAYMESNTHLGKIAVTISDG